MGACCMQRLHVGARYCKPGAVARCGVVALHRLSHVGVAFRLATTSRSSTSSSQMIGYRIPAAAGCTPTLEALHVKLDRCDCYLHSRLRDCGPESRQARYQAQSDSLVASLFKKALGIRQARSQTVKYCTYYYTGRGRTVIPCRSTDPICPLSGPIGDARASH